MDKFPNLIFVSRNFTDGDVAQENPNQEYCFLA